ncbi:MAG: hypothetical protein HY319_18140 [Armatimonadetes bacterium]|nr:hypothetical protein [Armatimonadota bacterium]
MNQQSGLIYQREDSLCSPEELALLGCRAGKYLIHYAFQAGAWDSGTQERARAYWASRRFSTRGEGATLRGWRGAVLGNLLSFDISRLMAELRVAGDAGGWVDCELHVDFDYQEMAPWNLVDFKLEPLLFREHLLGRPRPHFLGRMGWKRLPSQLAWCVGIRVADPVPPELKASIAELGDGGPLPTIRQISAD